MPNAHHHFSSSTSLMQHSDTHPKNISEKLSKEIYQDRAQFTMGSLLLSSAVILLLISLFVSTPFVLLLLGALTSVLVIFVALFLFLHVPELKSKAKRPPIAGSMLHQLVHFNTLSDHQTSLAKKHRTYRLIMPLHSEIYTTDPANVEYILKTNFPNYGRGAHIEIMRDLFGDGIFAVDGEKWRHQRKLASYEFSTRVLREYSSAVFRDNAAKLVAKVSTTAVANRAMDLQDLFMKSALDSIFKVGFGVELNALSGSGEFANRFTKAFDDSNFIVFRRYVDMFWKVKRFFNIGLEAALKRNVKIIDDFIFDLIRCKREQMENEKLVREKEDILSRFLMESKRDPENMNDRYLRDIILNFMIAGKDTSAGTLTWFFYMLHKHPLVQDKVVHEIRDATQAKDNICAEELSRLMTDDVFDRMHYLHAAITETLRLYPAVPADGKISVEDDVLPDGAEVKKGEGISYMAYAMGRMIYIWGEDAVEYRPERWLDEDGIFRPESPFKFTAFQAGPRICLGKEFAYRQMKIVAAVLLYLFKFRLVDETKEATYRTMFTLHMADGLHVYAFPRT
ncbi:cytochrome P450 704C1-like protein [Gossypium australe]|uniref:Cytochrome P450 704C1-like protein n=1 Tax=Gossypium australe TaxID=47621 RepID=A0A5B6UJH1_9ROSI|nr:cytochrome P450 704C1-like protein [Gossypium australe]